MKASPIKAMAPLGEPESYAFCYRSGEIGIGISVPSGALAFAKGRSATMHRMIMAASRHSHEVGVFLVPGIPEAATSKDAEDALLDWCDWLAQRPGPINILLAGLSKHGRSTSQERFQRTLAMLEAEQAVEKGGAA